MQRAEKRAHRRAQKEDRMESLSNRVDDAADQVDSNGKRLTLEEVIEKSVTDSYVQTVAFNAIWSRFMSIVPLFIAFHSILNIVFNSLDENINERKKMVINIHYLLSFLSSYMLFIWSSSININNENDVIHTKGSYHLFRSFNFIASLIISTVQCLFVGFIYYNIRYAANDKQIDIHNIDPFYSFALQFKTIMYKLFPLPLFYIVIAASSFLYMASTFITVFREREKFERTN